MIGRIPILDVTPSEGCGRWPAKAVVGETFTVSATVFREGHDAVNANVALRDPREGAQVGQANLDRFPLHRQERLAIDLRMMGFGLKKQPVALLAKNLADPTTGFGLSNPIARHFPGGDWGHLLRERFWIDQRIGEVAATRSSRVLAGGLLLIVCFEIVV